jgi:hypothetical protein
MPESYLTYTSTEFSIQNVSQIEVYELLFIMKTSKSAGHAR